MTDRDNNEELAALRWACRRGMLELDLLLRQFLEAQYQHLTPSEQGLFKELLACTDPDLFAWLLGSSSPTYSQFLPLLKKIQAYAHTGTSSKTV